MIICTSRTCEFKKVCDRQRAPTKNDKIFDLTNSCSKLTGYDFFIHNINKDDKLKE